MSSTMLKGDIKQNLKRLSSWNEFAKSMIMTKKTLFICLVLAFMLMPLTGYGNVTNRLGYVKSTEVEKDDNVVSISAPVSNVKEKNYCREYYDIAISSGVVPVLIFCVCLCYLIFFSPHIK